MKTRAVKVCGDAGVTRCAETLVCRCEDAGDKV
jgi:hypothetical protein